MKTQRYSNKGFQKKYVEKTETHKLVPFQKILELLGDVTGKKVHDLGCGTGDLSYDIALRGAKVVATDKSAEWIKECKKRYAGIENLNFLKQDAVKQKFPDKTFDAVVMNMVLINVDTFKEVSKIIQEIARTLKDDGVLIFSDLHPICIMTKDYRNRYQKYSKNFSYFKNGSSFTAGIRLESGQNMEFKDIHWTLESYTDILSKAGLYIHKIVEPTYPNNAPKSLRGYEIPEYILFFCKKLER